jgi:hypothetical protein
VTEWEKQADLVKILVLSTAHVGLVAPNTGSAQLGGISTPLFLFVTVLLLIKSFLTARTSQFFLKIAFHISLLCRPLGAENKNMAV